MSIPNESFLRPFPDSIEEHNRREEQIEGRQQAIGRYRRQQAELFELDQLFPECPNCGEHGAPVLGLSRDASTGYSADEQGCTVCLPR